MTTRSKTDTAYSEGFRAGIEAAAKVADDRAKKAEWSFSRAVEAKHADHQTHFAAKYQEDTEIAQAIRPIKETGNAT